MAQPSRSMEVSPVTSALHPICKMKTLIVFYDGWCPLCRASADQIARWDWRSTVQLYSFRDEAIQKQFSLDTEELERRIGSIRIHDGRWFTGIHTILQIALRLPFASLFVPFIWLSIQIGIGDRLYDWIASKRTIVPVGGCDDSTCQLHRDQDGNST